MPKTAPTAFASLPVTGLIVSLTVLSAPVAAQDGPAEAFCLPADRFERQACVALFLDEDGYEICLSDMAAGTERCFSLYHAPDQPPPELEPRPGILPGAASARLLRI